MGSPSNQWLQILKTCQMASLPMSQRDEAPAVKCLLKYERDKPERSQEHKAIWGKEAEPLRISRVSPAFV